MPNGCRTAALVSGTSAVRLSSFRLYSCGCVIHAFHVNAFVNALCVKGENNCHGTMGNSANHQGYGCQMPAMVDLWRKKWSQVPGTTSPTAPFGELSGQLAQILPRSLRPRSIRTS
jgi:hypothetical protein